MKNMMIIIGFTFILLFMMTPLDYMISEAIYQDSPTGVRFTSMIVYVPSYFLATLALMIIFKRVMITAFTYKRVLIVLLIFLFIANFSAFAYRIYDDLTHPFIVFPLMVLFMLLISMACILALTKNTLMIAQKLALLYVGTFSLMHAGVNTIKVIWGRTRFYATESAQDFSYWFIPQGFFKTDTVHLSLPSGHVATAAMVFIIIFIPMLFPKFKPYQWLLVVLSVGWVLFTIITRVMFGQHYVTDTLISVLMIALFYTILGRILLREYYK